MANKKQYGLSFPTKKPLSTPKVGNVFGNDDDSEEEEGTDWVKKALKAENEKNKIKKQTKLDMQKALKEDPTIFQYDEVYDEMERTKEQEKSVNKIERKAKYIDNLIKSAELRKKEQELRKDRMIQKEIEEEEAMFPDKERYVTSSYKAKLEEMKKFEEEQKNQDRLESIGDVTKQKDISGFYRHLFRQKVERNEADLGIIKTKPEGTENSHSKVKIESNIDQDDPILSNSDSENEDNKSENEKTTKLIKAGSSKRKRQYRQKVQEVSESESESDQEIEKSSEKIDGSNKKSGVEDKSESPSKKPRTDVLIANDKEDKENIVELNENVKKASDNEIKTDSKESTKNNSETNVEEIKKKKINIYEKRTIGPLFEAALQRYLLRKQERYGSL
ncbi:nuclear speckle splicing regulatory protein 1 [Phymastichus coffea]|uniref:nuclear speckle splicing regulatory protein 1 n=1 Tax=Phymastichus coffea TaxID=108790 RepID=UPI00273C772C|nr:nuclear speckle splicing regulatory protein 1 [Phymastichus coffea]